MQTIRPCHMHVRAHEVCLQGFLPEEIDQLVSAFVYPASLPTLAAFLASSLFLLFKVCLCIETT